MLSDRHNHDGSSGNGPRVRLRDIIDAERFAFIPAGQFEETNANVALGQFNNFAVLSFTDGVSGVATVSFMLPATKKSISSIKILFNNRTASSVLRLAYNFERARLATTQATDSLAEASYTTGATVNTLYELEIPKTAWDGLLQLTPFDILGLKITRSGASASDTYNAALEIYGLLIEFS